MKYNFKDGKIMSQKNIKLLKDSSSRGSMNGNKWLFSHFSLITNNN